MSTVTGDDTSANTSLNSFFPDQTLMPSLNESDFLNSDDNADFGVRGKSSKLNVVKTRSTKIRPSLFDYYVRPAADKSRPENDKDIDDSFDFLDEELNKISK